MLVFSLPVWDELAEPEYGYDGTLTVAEEQYIFRGLMYHVQLMCTI